MGQLLEAMQVGAQIAAQRNQRLAQIEAQRQRQAEALAMQQYRDAQLVNQARDDARAQKAAESLAEWHSAENRRRAQADMDRSGDRILAAEDRAAGLKEKSDAAKEKSTKAQKTAEFYARFGRNVSPAQLADMQAADPGWQGPLPNTPKMGVIDAAADAMAAVPEGVDPQVIERLITAQSTARAQREIPDEPIVMEKNGSKFYLGANGWQPVPGGMGDKANFYQETFKEPGSNKTTRRMIRNEKPEVPATPEQTAALAEFYARRSAAPAVVPAQPPPNRANNRQGNAPVVKAQKSAAKPAAADGERVRVLDKNGKPFTVFKSKLDAFLKANPDFREE